MARTSSLNCLSCSNPCQTHHSLNPSPLSTENPFFCSLTEKCFVASPKSAPRVFSKYLTHVIVRIHRIGANPEKSDLVNFRGLNLRRFSELCVLLFSPRKNRQNPPKPRFSKLIFGHSAGSTELDRPYCKQFRYYYSLCYTGSSHPP